MNSGMVNAGWVMIRMYRLCRSISSSSRGPLRPRAGGRQRAQRERHGAPSSSRIGDSMLITMCCTMCTLNMTMP